MRPSTYVTMVRIVAAAVFIGAAGLLVQSFAEGEQDTAQSPAGEIAAAKAVAAAGESAFPGFLVEPVKVRTVKVPIPTVAPSVPTGSDPRWAKAEHGGPAVAAPQASALPDDSPRLASLTGHEPASTGISITGSTAGAPEIDIARHEETREYVPVDEAMLAAASKDFADDVETAARTSRITSDVRLRSRGSNDSRVVGVIPGGSSVGVVRCASWCEVTYQGKRGWVYSGFVSGHQGRRRAVSRAAPAAEKAATEEAVAEAKPQATWASRLFGNPEEAPETGSND